MLDLNGLPARYLERYGEEKVAEVSSVTVATVRSWVNKEKWPLDAVHRLLQFDPAPIHEVKPLYENPAAGTRLAILMPSNRPTDPRVFEALMRMYDPAKMQIKTFTFNNLNVVRNMAAGWFLGTKCEISYWNDDDVVPPFGDAAEFKRMCELPTFPDAFAGINTINKLFSTGKEMVGVSYTGRKYGVPPQMSGGNTPAGKQDYARGPRNQLIPREWVGFGGVMIHRSVFEKIIKTHPEIELPAGHQLRAFYRYGFFDALPNVPGDDISFCLRAKKASVEIFADLSLMASHIGTKCFNYSDLK